MDNTENCICCGRKNAYLYSYYQGVIYSKTTDVYLNSKVTTTRYDKIEEHSDYVCARCGYREVILDLVWTLAIVVFVGGILVSILIMFATFGKDDAANSENVRHIIAMAISLGTIFVVAILIWITVCLIRWKMGKGVGDETGAQIIIDKKLKTASERTVFFSPKEYKGLERMNR
jgi:hypothetical protein